jgi:acetylornithine deacetylase/succinyl-diaminopimelate desuccinylase-like protein
MAAMLWGLWEMRTVIPTLRHEIWFAGLAGEEAGQHGAHALAKEEQFSFVIAGEPTNLQIVHTHKGCTNLRIVTRGKAVHASQPESGENAIYKMAEVIRFIRQKMVPELHRHSHPILGRSTISVGTVEGGSKTNIVPDYCEATVDIRTVPTQNTPEFTERLTERLRVACPDVEVYAGHSPPLLTDPSHPTIGLLQNLGSRCVGAPWFCDAAVFARDGTPSIALGPGSIAQAHTKDEWIKQDDLEKGAEFFAKFLRLL